MKKLKEKVIFILLTVIVIFNTMPLSILAEEINIYKEVDVYSDVDVYKEDNAKEEKVEDVKEANKEVKIYEEINDVFDIVGEDKTKREKNVKHFVLSNGNIQASVYGEAVHYLKDSKWEDIDNSLINSKDDDNEDVMENKENSFKVKFANKSKDNKLMNIKNSDFNIKWSLKNSNKVKVEILNKSENSNKKNLVQNISSSVIYSNIMDNVDIIYDINPESVKENIILKNKSASNNKFEFVLDVGKLQAKLNQDKSISVLDGEKEVVKIDSPFMYDNNFEYSSLIDVNLVKNKKDYIMTITPNKEWLNDENRVYPVTIDPTVNTSLNSQDIKDTYIYSGDNSNPDRYRAHILRVGGGTSKIFRTLIKFNLPVLSAGDQVINAKLGICNYPDTDEWNPWNGQIQVNVHKVTSNWVDSTANWANNANNYDPRVVDYVMYQYEPSNNMKQNIMDVTSIVKDWYVTGNNYGLMLKQESESLTNHNDAYFLSSNTTASSYLNYRPIVSIVYRNQTGLEDYLSYHTQNIGRSGTSYINDYNGNMVLTHDDVTTPGNLMPVTINHVYNTNDKNVNIGFGSGFRLNISQMISLVTISGINYAKYIDEDGTAHYFEKQGSSNIYKDEDGLSLTLTLNSDTTFTMKDKGDNTLTFEKKVVSGSELWHLNKITSSEGKNITISFLNGYPNHFYIEKVTDGAGSILTFSWNYGLLQKIKNQNDEYINYTYDNINIAYSNIKLSSIKYIDNKISSYTYDDKNLITSVKNIDNSKIEYIYNSALPYRIKEVKQYSSNNEIGNTLTYTYGNNSTTFTDNKGYSNTYSFTNSGQLVNISDYGNNKNDITKAYGKMYNYGTSGNENNKLKLETRLISPVNNLLANPSMERNSDWTYWYWGSDNGKIEYVNNQTYVGNRSIKVSTNQGITLATMDHRIYAYQYLPLVKGKTYTLSAYVKTENITNTKNGGALIYVYYATANGRKTYDSEIVNLSSDWQKLTCTFKYESEATTEAIISLGIVGEAGTAYFDAIQVEESEVANTYNLIENSGFDKGNLNWTFNEDCNGTDNISNQNGYRELKLTGDVYKRKYVTQKIYVKGKKGDIFTASSWSRNRTVATNDRKACGIAILVHGVDGTNQWTDIYINPNSDMWEYNAVQFVTDSDYNYIEVYLKYYFNANEIYYDNVSLFKEEFGQSYSYDSKGNLISTQDLAKENSTIKYSGNNDMLSNVNPKGGKYVYEYDFLNKHRLIKATNNLGQSYSFEYDSNGNATSAKVESSKNKTSNISAGKTYYIRLKSSNKQLDVEGYATANGTKLSQYSYHGKTNQQFKLIDASNGYYNIQPINAPNTNLDFETASGILQIWTKNNLENQKWKITKIDENSYIIKSKYNEGTKVLTLEKDTAKDSIRFKQAEFENKDSQKFEFIEVTDNSEKDRLLIESNDVYYIKSAYSNLYLDYEKDSNGNILTDSNGVKVVQRDYSNKSKSQLWRIVRLENGRYKLIPLNSLTGRAMTVKDNINANDITVELKTNTNNDESQEWGMAISADGKVQLEYKDKYLTIYSNVTTPEAKMVIYQYTGGQNQYWYLEPANMLDIESEASYKIKNNANGNYVGVKDGLDASGANVEQVSPEALNKEWTIKNLYNGYYKIIAKHSVTNRVLDIAGGSSAQNANIQLGNDISLESQQWEIVPNVNGTYTFKPRNCLGEKTLDIATGSNAVGANIQLYPTNGSSAQEFVLEKTTELQDKYIESKTEYSENGRFVSKIKDVRDKETNYTYNFSNNKGTGTLKSKTDSKLNKTNYTYDNLNRLTNVSLVDGEKTYGNSYTYTNDRLTNILHNGYNIKFEYDNYGNSKKVKIENIELITNNYEANNGNLLNSKYGNNQTVSYSYDRFSRLSVKTMQDGAYNYAYDNKGNVALVKDNVNKITHKYTYDLADRLVRHKTDSLDISYKYDVNSNINEITEKYDKKTNTTKYNYDMDNKISSIRLLEDRYVNYIYDNLARINKKTLNINNKKLDTTYEYIDVTNNKTTGMLKSIKNGENEKITYIYDANGNIETISKGDVLEKKYYYDALNQLIREDNKEIGNTIVYTYDIGGNRIKTNTYGYTIGEVVGVGITNFFAYDTYWTDKLTTYVENKDIRYVETDEIGNMTSYNGNTYTWINGRQLSKIQSTNKTINYKYNDSGIRTQKEVNGEITKYHVDGNKIIYEVNKNGIIHYKYDEQGNLIGFDLNNENYYYLRNGQGDIKEILDNNLNSVISYTYDTWGKIVKITNNENVDVTENMTSIGNINPYRYRGYYYDTETKMYYLQSRYYMPEFGRFINADNYVSTGQGLLSHNVFIYCNNNPVNMEDVDGEFALSLTFIGAMAVMAIPLAYTIVKDVVIPSASQFVNLTFQTANNIANSIKKGYNNTQTIQIDTFAKSKPNPLRPGVKGQGLENHGKNRNNEDWKDKSGKRRPSAPKKHTPGRDHRKYLNFISLTIDDIEIKDKVLLDGVTTYYN